MSLKRIAHSYLDADASQIEFSNIPVDGTYDGLLLRLSSRTTRSAGVAGGVGIQFNGDTSGNYRFRYLRGWNGVTETYSDSVEGTGWLYAVTTQSTYASNVFGTLELQVLKYHLSGEKAIGIELVAPNLGTPYFVYRMGGRYLSTSPINSIRIFDSTSNNFVAGTTATLFGLKSGSDGTTTIT